MLRQLPSPPPPPLPLPLPHIPGMTCLCCRRDDGALHRAKTNWQGLLQSMGYCLPSETTAVRFVRKSSDRVQEELDEDMAQEIARIPEVGAYERLSHVVGLSKLCCRRFIQLGGVTKMILKGLKGRCPTSAEACRTAAHVNVFCKLHAARDQVPLFPSLPPSFPTPRRAYS